MTVPSYAIGRLTLHPHRELLDRGAPVAIGGRALDLLSVLAAAEGGVVSKDELIAQVWRGAIVEDNALQAQISSVRKALGSEASRLVTMHGRGYRLELGGPTTAATTPPHPNAVAVAVAVFAFENLTGDSANDYLAEGLAEELMSDLARIPDLMVPAFGSLGFRGTGIDLRAMAREMGVAHVLEGKLRVANGRLCVTAELVDIATGQSLWTRVCEGDLGRLLALQNELSESVAAALGRDLGPRFGPPTSSEALRLVLHARRIGRTMQMEALGRAIELARKATVLDPGHASAWNELATQSYVMTFVRMADRAFVDKARDHAEHALRLDPNLSNCHVALGGLDAFAGDWLGATGHYERARDLGHGLHGLGHAQNVLLPAGRNAESAKLLEHSIPFSGARAHPAMAWAACSWLAGDFAAARAHIDAAVLIGVPGLRPGFNLVVSEEAYARGAFDEARAAHAPLASALALPEAEDTIGRVYAALAHTDDPAAASEALGRLFAAADRSGSLWRQPDTAAPFALWQVRLGNLDAAFVHARRIVERWRETGLLANFSLTPLWPRDMERFRADPRFQEIVRDLGLFPYWERYGPPDGHVVRDGRLVAL